MKPQSVNRRRFLTISAATLASCALGCAGLEAVLKNSDNPNTLLPIGFPELGLGDRNSKRKILVAYASAAGSTGGVAETIAETLAESGEAVDLRRVSSNLSIEPYTAVVLGSAIHGGKWLPEAAEFLKHNKTRLNQIPTAFFLVGLMVNKKNPSDQKLVDQFLASERELVKPVAEGKFVGALFTKKYPGMTGFGMRFFVAYCGLGLRGGDFRNPTAIHAWANGILPMLIS
jgi:menaquinone-dependent protoporphyrinogen oxidase